MMVLLLLICLICTANGQLNRFKVPRHRVGSSKFSLNPLKPLMNLMRQDPMKAAAQRHHPKYLPPPPGMYPSMHHPARAASSMSYGVHPYRPYPSQYTRYLPPSTLSLVPPLSAAPSSLVYSSLMNDHHYRPLPSDLQIKAVRIPSKVRRPTPTSVDSLNIADSVVRQLLDFPQQNQQQQTDQSYPSVLVIEDPDVSSSSAQSEILSESSLAQPSQKLVIAPPVHADFSPDSSSADISSSSQNNPEVFVIVSKNNKNKNNYYIDEKKPSEILTPSSSKLKKYKITQAYDENGGRQVWIIK